MTLDPRGGRTPLVGAALVVAAAFAGIRADGQELPSASTPSVALERYRTLAWSDLIPTNWRPPDPARSWIKLSDASVEAKDALAAMRSVLDAAPSVEGLNDTSATLSGYVVPLESAQGKLKEFLLVPYFGACIHTPPPPANQIVFTRLSAGNRELRTMDTVRVSGRLFTTRQDSAMGAGGYRMDAALVERLTSTR